MPATARSPHSRCVGQNRVRPDEGGSPRAGRRLTTSTRPASRNLSSASSWRPRPLFSSKKARPRAGHRSSRERQGIRRASAKLTCHQVSPPDRGESGPGQSTRVRSPGPMGPTARGGGRIRSGVVSHSIRTKLPPPGCRIEAVAGQDGPVQVGRPDQKRDAPSPGMTATFRKAQLSRSRVAASVAVVFRSPRIVGSF